MNGFIDPLPVLKSYCLASLNLAAPHSFLYTHEYDDAYNAMRIHGINDSSAISCRNPSNVSERSGMEVVVLADPKSCHESHPIISCGLRKLDENDMN